MGTLLLVHGTHLALDVGILVLSLIVLDLVDSAVPWDMPQTDESVDDLHLLVLCCVFDGSCGMGLAAIRDGIREAREIAVGFERNRSV